MSKIDPNQVIDFLNSLIEIDRDAISDLMTKRVACNKELGEHETVQTLVDNNSNYSVGLLGILNGMCGKDENDWGFIVARVNEDTDKIESFIHLKDKPKV